MPRHVKFPVYNEDGEYDGVGVGFLTGGELADAILALPELGALRRDAALGRWVRENTNEWDRLNNPVVAGAWHVWEVSS